nr:MAG TPA: hypothetical protein [Caudoviricetes sp.]
MFNLFLCNVLSYLRDRCSVPPNHNIPPHIIWIWLHLSHLYQKKIKKKRTSQ